jgi:hypothetical protein
MNSGRFPPRGYVDRRQWLAAEEESDPGDVARPVGVKFIPHSYALPGLIEVMSVEEHEHIMEAALGKLEDTYVKEMAESNAAWRRKLASAEAREIEHIADCMKLSERVEELEAALRKFGLHDAGCGCVRPCGPDSKCDCGFVLALNGESKKEKQDGR